jgi:hypothetical protein
MNWPLQILGEQTAECSKNNLTEMNFSYISKKWSEKEVSNFINIGRAGASNHDKNRTLHHLLRLNISSWCFGQTEDINNHKLQKASSTYYSPCSRNKQSVSSIFKYDSSTYYSCVVYNLYNNLIYKYRYFSVHE